VTVAVSKGRRHRGSSERFIALPHWLLKSPAWRALSPNAKAVLLHLWERHNGSNNGAIVYAVREAGEIGITRPTTARALIELIDKGFLRVTRWSSFRLKSKEAREWELTAEPVDGRPATKDFMRWRGKPKFKTRSHQRATQSHQRDRDHENDPKNGVTVSPVRLSAAKSTASQSHQRDTSSIPGGPPRFGDLAKEARTARAPQSPREEEEQQNILIVPSGASGVDTRAVKRQSLMRRALAEAKRRLSPSNYLALENELHTDGNYDAFLKRGSDALPPRLRDFFETMFSVTQDAAPPTDAIKVQGWMPLPIDGGHTREPLPTPAADSPSAIRCAAALDRSRTRTGG
jgi:hypothetical protein